MIDGVTVRMGGRDWVVPALTLGQLRKLGPRIDQISAGPGAAMDGEAIAALVQIVAAALSRNYPDITAEQVEDLLDLGNSQAVLKAVLTGSGLQPREGAVAGEASAVSIGAGSTASSPPPAATAPAT